MNTIIDRTFEGERALFGIQDTRLSRITFLPGESPVKQARNIAADHCHFRGKYPFWHNTNLVIEDCEFSAGARAAIWYTSQVTMKRCLVEAPKMFREVTGLTVEDTVFPDAAEFLWNCSDVTLHRVEVSRGDYIFMNGRNIRIDGFHLQGNYSFQDARDVVIRNAKIDSKDAFWNAENVTVIDSIITGEYLGWHSRNLRLINCVITGTQPLCYASGLVMENCTMKEADLCFEYSTLDADICSDVISIKNPAGGTIRVHKVGLVIIDSFCPAPGSCEIIETDEVVEVVYGSPV
ncbi:Protein of uncharacterised function (DUF3737) [Klebsiella variicola]|uniref:Protein of uncharacterized function (DUF3737) n=1 Tax=Klebsiella variicola TaxID=244366 RepID=A0ABD7PE95_KLEVA|nr:DUF3737 family protein [Klebsiella variicola]SXF99578.1 Protein of uncharacterised function (DUF3737) [Klebsiella variicola]